MPLIKIAIRHYSELYSYGSDNDSYSVSYEDLTEWSEVTDEQLETIKQWIHRASYQDPCSKYMIIEPMNKKQATLVINDVLAEAKKAEEKRIESQKKLELARKARADKHAETKRLRDLKKLEKLKKDLGVD